MPTNQTLIHEVESLQGKIDQVKVPDELKTKLTDMVDRLRRSAEFGTFTEEFERVNHYINWVTQIPWEQQSPDALDLQQARLILDKHHYGLDPVKNRILEYLAVLKLNLNNPESITHAPIICLVGLAGTGKTTFAYALAEAMGRQIARIPFGGLGSARDLRGQSRLHLEAEPGYIVKGLVRAGTINPVMLLDEIDRVTAEARADVMGVLLELLDPGQNKAFIDHYVDYPINLNQVLFIATANNTDNVSTAVKNRLEILEMPTYSDQEKIIIAKNYVLPQAIKEAGLKPDQLTIDDAIWPDIVRPLGFESGIRLLKRTIEGMARKVAFHVVQGNTNQVHLNHANLKDFVDQYY